MEQLLEVAEVARLIKVHPVTVRRLLLEGKLKGIKAVTRKWLVRESALEDYLNRDQTHGGQTVE